MKSLLALALVISASAYALSPVPQPTAFKSTEVVSCVNGNESLTVQVLTGVGFSDEFAFGTFVDYKKNGVSVYSSSSFDKPQFIAAGAGVYYVKGNGTEADKQISFGLDYMSYNVYLEKNYGKTVIAFMTNCTQVGDMSKYVNIGNPRVETKPSPAPKKPRKPTPYKKI